MSLESDTILLQRFAGLTGDDVDGDPGPQTMRALVVKLGLDGTGRPQPNIKVCVDVGHGRDNKKMGTYDPGCVHGALEEADIAMDWGKELVRALNARSIATFETRPTKTSSAPVGTRDDRAKQANCTHLISIHVNDADSAQAHGTETLYAQFAGFAQGIQNAAMAGLKLTDRGIKQRLDLSVLKFQGPACLLELGFIQNAADRERFLDAAVRRETCRLIAATFG